MSDTRAPMAGPDADIRLLIGSADAAGSATQWARAAQTLPSVSAKVHERHHPSPASLPASDDSPLGDRSNRRAIQELLASSTHVLAEGWQRLVVGQPPTDAGSEARSARRFGVQFGVLSHGDELRMPDEHWDREPWSPFRHFGRGDLGRISRHVGRFRPMVREQEWVYVSDPALIDQVAHARWLPWVAGKLRWEVKPWQPAGEVPLVVHVANDPVFAGTNQIREPLQAMADAGRIRYLELDSEAALTGVVADAAIVLDQFALGTYGLAACHGMLAGRVVIGHVSEIVRARVSQATGLALPVIEANPHTIAEVLTEVISDPDRMASCATAGAAFGSTVHDGRLAARILAEYLF